MYEQAKTEMFDYLRKIPKWQADSIGQVDNYIPDDKAVDASEEEEGDGE